MIKYTAISIDMDHELDYAAVYGERIFKITKERLYEESLPRILRLIDLADIKATFFIIGRDLLVPTRLRVLKKLLSQGHELANHTFSHIHNFHLLPKKKKREEIEKTHDLAWKKLRTQLVGFRSPGYNITQDTISIIHTLKYAYDSSIHPTVLHPFFRIALLVKTRQRNSLNSMGPNTAMFAPTEPYHCSIEKFPKQDRSSSLVEIPIRVLPFLRLPFFGTLHLQLGIHSFKIFTPLLQKMKIINYEIHGIDLINKPSGSFSWFRKHPGMHRTPEDRISLYQYIFEQISRDSTILPLKTIARRI